MWEATNPQFVVWVNGRIEQSFDTRHTSLTLENEAVPGKKYEIFLQGYANVVPPNHGSHSDLPPRLGVYVNDVCEDVVQLCYDLDVPYQALLLEPEGCRDRETGLYTISDALNLLAATDAPARKQGDLLTPHPGEAARLLGWDTAGVTAAPLEALRALQARWGGAVLLKGATSLMTDGVRTAANATRR